VVKVDQMGREEVEGRASRPTATQPCQMVQKARRSAYFAGLKRAPLASDRHQIRSQLRIRLMAADGHPKYDASVVFEAAMPSVSARCSLAPDVADALVGDRGTARGRTLFGPPTSTV
jgi:hypothetical protein